jgi:fumarate reductase subunit D
MPQIETAYFITRLPPGMLPRLFIAGIIIAAVFAPLAVLILGKAKPVTNETGKDARLKLPLGSWVTKLALIVVSYLLIYFTFGYFIAWKVEAVRVYYHGDDPGNFFTHMAHVLRTEPLLFVLQAVRALLWAAIAVPVIKMMKGDRWETGLAVALLFAIMTSLLLLPNPLMPDEVRMTHLLETATSNFLFGWLVVLILRGTDRARVKLATQSTSGLY